MHFRLFDDLMGSAPKASPEFRFEKGREYSEIITHQIIKKLLGKFT